MAVFDKKRFRIELKYFEKLGYYVKVDINYIIKFNISDKNNINSEAKKVFTKKKSINTGNPKGSKKTKYPPEVGRAKTPCKSNIPKEKI